MTERPLARPMVGEFRSRRPPPAVLAVGAALILLVPFWQAVQMSMRDWSYGGSPAAEFDAPYVWGVAMLRTAGAVLLGLLVLALRRPAAPWVAIVSVWLAGPPLSYLSVGILHLSASAGQRSVPDDWSFAWIWFVFPLLVTAGLLGSRRARDYYRC